MSKQNNGKAHYEFWRAMYIFYRKHYAQSTSFWVHYLVLCGLVLRGGRRMLREIVRSERRRAPAGAWRWYR